MCRYSKLFLILILFCFVSFGRVEAEEVLTWGACIKEAAKHHPDIIASGELIKQSEAIKQQTASGLFPQITGDLSASTTKTSSANASSSTQNSYAYGVSGTQLLFDAGKTINNVKAAEQNIKASQQGYRFISSEVRLRLRTAFVNLLRSQELVHVAEDIIKIRKGSLELITLNYESGLEHKGALLTAEANLAEANFELAQASRNIALAQRQLTKEMGREKFIPMNVKGDFKVSDAAQEKPDFEILAANNPALKQLTAQKNAAQFGLKSAYANFFPNLSGQAGANRTAAHWPPQNDQWNLGLSLSFPIFEGDLRFAQVSQARALLNQLKENERSTKDGVVVNLEQTWASLQDAMETVEVQYKSLIATEERSKIAEAEYSTGFITYDNWTIIEDNLVSAKIKYLDAQANALFAEANWIQTKGETLEYAQ